MLVSMLSLEQPFLSSAKLHEVLAEQVSSSSCRDSSSRSSSSRVVVAVVGKASSVNVCR